MVNLDTLVPRFQCPDPQIEEIFRYRWYAYSTHIEKRQNGKFVITEFSTPVRHSGVDGTISCPAQHHIYEGRWIQDHTFIRDYITFWCSSEAAPRLYSFPLADSCFKYCLVSGEDDLAADLFDAMKENYFQWEKDRLDENTGLFWQIPDRDGMEFALLALDYGKSHGGEGYRSTLNSYMYSDAIALAHIAQRAGRSADAELFREKAEKLKQQFLLLMWNKKRSFFVDRRRDNRFFINGAELHGYLPWSCNLPDERFNAAWKYIMDSEYFNAPCGLRTVEKNHEDYLVEHGRPGGCMWNGWCWPFAFSQALTSMANFINDYQQNEVSAADYFQLFKKYTAIHYKDGKPHLAESCDPETGEWYADFGPRSLNYNHSSYCDQLITGVAGLRIAPDGSLKVNPLIPDDWDYFALTGVPFRGALLDIIFDRSGKKFSLGKGVSLLSNGNVINHYPMEK
ncbi:MAG: hypothetical protein IJY46_09720 [Lentisphaeria bacterium]|nr:hypothetical protein [Lentisphaeria bacterium]